MTKLSELTNYCIDHRLDLKILTFNSMLFDRPTSNLMIMDKLRATEHVIFYYNFSALPEVREEGLEKAAEHALRELKKYVNESIVEPKKIYKFW